MVDESQSARLASFFCSLVELVVVFPCGLLVVCLWFACGLLVVCLWFDGAWKAKGDPPVERKEGAPSQVPWKRRTSGTAPAM